MTGARAASKLKVPHMGWNQVRQARAHPLWAGIADGARFYFVHSYHPLPAETGADARERPLPGAVYLRGCAG